MNQSRLKSMDYASGMKSNVPLLVLFWMVVILLSALDDVRIAVGLFIGLAVVFVIHFIVSEGIFKRGAKLFSLERIRPYRAFPDEIHAIGKRFQDSSFPSSHMASMVGGLIVLVHFYGFLWPLAVLIAGAIGWSRLRNGMHYPSDILAGIVLGIAYGVFTLSILNPLILKIILLVFLR